ncbi:carbon storage regulator [Agromyces sp. NPDC057679]|uniref:carbon storage regulator n=1 Tax=Agromyces sp. NPDC057679 TaxID=3346207 RepID=UPI00366E4F01
MLILTRKFGEQILIGDDIVVTVLGDRSGGQVRLQIDAPRNIKILRPELLDEVERQNREAASEQNLDKLLATVQVPRAPIGR